MNWPSLLLLSAAGVCASGADLASWRAGATPDGIQPEETWKTARTAGVTHADLAPVNDSYRRAAFAFRLERPPAKPAFLSVRFLDRGYGLVSIPGFTPCHGIAVLNSGKPRQAVFSIDAGIRGRFRVQGVRHLISVTLTDTEPAAEPPPGVSPAFVLKHPMDLVVSAGADAPTRDGLHQALAAMRLQLPLWKALGFTGIESYVKWNFVETEPGKFDWTFYDAIVDELARYGMKWFPLLVVGSAYTLPEWFYESSENRPFICLEHDLPIDVPTIFSGTTDKYARAFLAEFGRHYRDHPTLLGVRLGPTANYGEAQYPATGAMTYKNKPLHTHIGYWAGDPAAADNFRAWARIRYPTLDGLNKAWGTPYASFEDVRPFLPVTALTPRMRHDFATWYIDAMTAWCEQWAKWAREAMPRVSIYQSSGGWGAVEIGTDYAAHTKSMGALGGGIRLTNENDSYLNNYSNTRLAASATRLYHAKYGSEPAGFSSRRGVVNRLYSAITNNSSHLFYYGGNLTDNDQAIDSWLEFAPLLDRRAAPRAEVAIFFNDTANKLRDDTLRYLRASAWISRVQALREIGDFDFISEQMVLDGGLSRYKALVMVWGNTTTQPVLEAVAKWVDSGGVVYSPDRELSREGGFQSLDGDLSVYKNWQDGNTGKGRVFLFDGHTEPFSVYVRYLREQLARLDVLSPELRALLAMPKPADVYWSLLDDGGIVLLNYGDTPATVTPPGRKKPVELRPYSIAAFFAEP